MSEKNAYTTMDVVARTRATYRQVDWWDRTGLARPSITPALGSGTQRAYSPADLWRVAIIKTLLDAGLSLVAVREVVDQACEHETVVLTECAVVALQHERLAAKVRVDPPARLRLVRT